MDKVCGDKVCVDKVCGDKVYVDKVCVDKVWRRAEEEAEPGIQNQKQEPHTKMWGTKLYKELLSAIGKRPQMRNIAILWTYSPIVK